ncbi:hypothetical protein ACWCOV_33440 [Kribbella sp. NPDC002412]
MLVPPFARRPQNAPVSTEPVTFRPAGSIEISASSLPFSEFDVRKSRFAAWSAEFRDGWGLRPDALGLAE